LYDQQNTKWKEVDKLRDELYNAANTLLEIHLQESQSATSLEELTSISEAIKYIANIRLFIQYMAHDVNAYLLAHLGRKEEFPEHVTSFKENRAKFLEHQAKHGGIPAAEKPLTDALTSKGDQFETESLALFDNYDKTQEKWQAADKASDEINDAITGLVDIHNKELLDIKNQTFYVIITLTLTILILSIGLGLFISNRITKPLEKLTKTVDAVSKGNLDAQVEKTSSIKEINILADSLDRVMTTMKRSIKRLDEGKKKE
jgi:nitrogen fixation/metabolism regulation signal transduction histidine kinase